MRIAIIAAFVVAFALSQTDLAQAAYPGAVIHTSSPHTRGIHEASYYAQNNATAAKRVEAQVMPRARSFAKHPSVYAARLLRFIYHDI